VTVDRCPFAGVGQAPTSPQNRRMFGLIIVLPLSPLQTGDTFAAQDWPLPSAADTTQQSSGGLVAQLRVHALEPRWIVFALSRSTRMPATQ